MFLRYVDAFRTNNSYIKELPIIAIISTTAAAATISTSFARSKGSVSATRDLSTVDAIFSGAC
jgi:hypothetical protein